MINVGETVIKLQPRVVQTVQQHCLVWIYLDTYDMWLYSVECSRSRAV